MMLLLVLTTFQVAFAIPNPFVGTDPSPAIIGGEVSEKGKWPWVLAMTRLREGGYFSHTCGAALLTPDWILTAAHCVYESPPETLQILVGAFNQTAQDQEQTLNISSIHIHPNYDPTVFNVPNDVAVAELASPADLSNENIGLGFLPRSNDNFTDNPNCWAAGWGRYDPDPNNYETSPVLLEVTGRMPGHQECIEIWNEFAFPGFGEYALQEGVHLCFGGPIAGTCHGDSGSPLNCDMTGNGDWVMAGVTSWGSGELCLGATTVYAGILPHLDWIRDIVPGI